MQLPIARKIAFI